MDKQALVQLLTPVASFSSQLQQQPIITRLAVKLSTRRQIFRAERSNI